VYEANGQVQNYVGPIHIYHPASQRAAHIQTADWLKPEMVSIGLTLTSLFISGENGLQPMDIRDEEKTWLPLCSSFKKGYVKVRHFV
jgi:hypothetical protein